MVAFKHQLQAHAQGKVNNAIKAGKIQRGNACVLCEKTDDNIDGHHPDYRKPLFVIWLCHKCHMQHHENLRAADFLFPLCESIKAYLFEQNQRKIQQTGLLRGINKRFSKICY